MVLHEHARAAVAARRHRPVFMVDIAVPRDIEAHIGDLDDVYLYTVDDLQDVIQDNLRSREEAAQQAEAIIDTQVGELMGWLGSRDAVPLIRGLRANAEKTRAEVLEKAHAQLASGKSAEQVLEFLAKTLTNKLLHHPTTAMRNAGAEGRDDLLEAATSILGIPDETRADD